MPAFRHDEIQAGFFVWREGNHLIRSDGACQTWLPLGGICPQWMFWINLHFDMHLNYSYNSPIKCALRAAHGWSPPYQGSYIGSSYPTPWTRPQWPQALPAKQKKTDTFILKAQILVTYFGYTPFKIPNSNKVVREKSTSHMQYIIRPYYRLTCTHVNNPPTLWQCGKKSYLCKCVTILHLLSKYCRSVLVAI